MKESRRRKTAAHARHVDYYEYMALLQISRTDEKVERGGASGPRRDNTQIEHKICLFCEPISRTNDWLSANLFKIPPLCPFLEVLWVRSYAC